MKKKIIIALSVVILLLLGGFAYLRMNGPRQSPFKETTFNDNRLDIKVAYSQPYKKGRIIFGEASEAALQPFGKYWRLGANEATEITFSKNITFGNKAVTAGTYRMYAVPGASTWQVTLNSELGKSGSSAPDHAKDVATAEVAPATSPETEQFVINFSSDSTSVQMDFVWDKTLVRVPIRPQ